MGRPRNFSIKELCKALEQREIKYDFTTDPTMIMVKGPGRKRIIIKGYIKGPASCKIEIPGRWGVEELADFLEDIAYD